MVEINLIIFRKSAVCLLLIQFCITINKYKKIDEWFCSCAHNKAMIIGNIYTFSELDELSKSPKVVIAEF